MGGGSGRGGAEEEEGGEECWYVRVWEGQGQHEVWNDEVTEMRVDLQSELDEAASVCAYEVRRGGRGGRKRAQLGKEGRESEGMGSC